MKLVYPLIDHVFEIGTEMVNVLIIENPKMMRTLLEDIYAGTNGDEHKTIISDNNKEVPLNRNVEMITNYVPFELNQKSLLTKLYARIEKQALSDEHCKEIMEALSAIEKTLYEVSFGLNCDLDFSGLSAGSLIKAAGPRLKEEYTSLGEKLVDYFELVRELDRDKLFITVNLRSFIDEAETRKFMETCLLHGYKLLMIENREYAILPEEGRFIIDIDLCEIG